MKTEVLERCNVCDGDALCVVDPDCNIMRCRACGYIFDSPRPTLQELVEFYSRPGQYDSWLNELEPRERLWKRRLDALRFTKKPGSLFDVGAGIGQFLAVARDSYSEVHGTEVSSTAIQIAKERYNLNLFKGSIEDIHIAGGTFDNITLFHVLEHVPDPKLMLRTCHSLLSPRGILVIAVPNEVTSLRASLRKMLVRAGVKEQQPRVGKFGLPRTDLSADSPEVHLSHFTVSVLRRLVHIAGFSIVKETLDPYYVATGLSKLKADAYYYFCLAYLLMFRVNIYDSILIVAQKVETRSPREIDGGR
jgi:ubiquinone/menaquinone biosynthesis C-methylase UbiE